MCHISTGIHMFEKPLPDQAHQQHAVRVPPFQRQLQLLHQLAHLRGTGRGRFSPSINIDNCAAAVASHVRITPAGPRGPHPTLNGLQLEGALHPDGGPGSDVAAHRRLQAQLHAVLVADVGPVGEGANRPGVSMRTQNCRAVRARVGTRTGGGRRPSPGSPPGCPGWRSCGPAPPSSAEWRC